MAGLWCLSGGVGGGRPHAQRRQSVQAVDVQLLRVGQHRVLLLLRLLGNVLGQFRRQATQLPHTDDIDEHMARGKDRDSFHPPLCLPRGGEGRPDLRRLEWFDLRNMLLVARVVAATALAREESRGAHQREDFPATEPAWRVNQTVRWRDGAMTLDRSPAAVEMAAQ